MSKPVSEKQRREQIDRMTKQLVDAGNSNKYAREKSRELAYKADKQGR